VLLLLRQLLVLLARLAVAAPAAGLVGRQSRRLLLLQTPLLLLWPRLPVAAAVVAWLQPRAP
jgi:hypothetical protein